MSSRRIRRGRAAPLAVFRADASRELGLGHLMRCRALASRLRGFRVLFVVKSDPAAGRIMGGRMKPVFHARRLPAGISAAGEVKIIKNIIRREACAAPCVLVLDLLGYPPGYLKALRRLPCRIAAFHEKEPGDPYSDISVNYNPFRGYGRRAPETAAASGARIRCAGPSFAIFRDYYIAAARRSSGVRSPSARGKLRMLISMGGSDPNGITLRVLKGLLCGTRRTFAELKYRRAARRPDDPRRPSAPRGIEITAHMGPAFKHRREIMEFLRRRRGKIPVRTAENVPELGELIRRADVAVAGGGNTMYELCLMGVPSVIVCQNRHQSEFARELARRGAVADMGMVNVASGNRAAAAALALAADGARRRRMSAAGRKLFDGRGVLRLRDKIESIIKR